MHNPASFWAAALAAAALRGPFALADAAPAPNPQRSQHWSGSSDVESFTRRPHHNSSQASSAQASSWVTATTSSIASTSSTDGSNLFPPNTQQPSESATGLLGQNPLSVVGSVLGDQTKSRTETTPSPTIKHRPSSLESSSSSSVSSAAPPNPLTIIAPSSTITTSSSGPSKITHHGNGHASPSPPLPSQSSSSTTPSSTESPSGLLGGLTSALSSLIHGGSTPHPATKPAHGHRTSDTASILVGLSTIIESTSSHSGLNLGSLLPTSTGSGGLPLTSALSALPASVTGDLSSVLSSITDGILPSHQHHQPTGHGKHSSDESTSGLGLGITSIVPSLLSDATATRTAHGKGSTTAAPLPLSDLSSILSSVTKGAGSASVPLASALSSVLSQATGTDGTGLPVTLPSKVSSLLSHVTHGKLTHIVPSVVSSAESKVSGVLSSVESYVTSALPTGVPPVLSSVVSEVTSALPTPVPSILSTVKSHLSVALTPIPVPTIPASLVSYVSSALSSATSSLVSELPTVTGTLPTETGTTLELPTVPHHTLPTWTIPTLGTGTGILPTIVPSFSLSTTTDGTGTTAIPVPVSTRSTSWTSTNTASATTATSAKTSSHKTTPPPEVPATTPTTHSVPSSSFSSLSLSFDTTGVTSHRTSTTKFKEGEPTTSVMPIGTNTDKSLTLPTTWSFDPTAGNTAGISTATSTSGSTAVSGVIPTSMPQLIQPPGGIREAPANTTKVQLAFGYGLNYPFVASTAESAAQIFAYLPMGIAYGLDIPRDRVLMYSLQPYNTAERLGYVTTLALVYIPTELVGNLQLDLHTPLSRLYHHPNPTVHRLMNMLNSAIDIQPGNNVDSQQPLPWSPVSPSSVSVDDAAPFGGDSGNTKHVVYSAVGIGAGAAAGAALYAASMVYIARRYSRRRRAHHQRASSVPAAGTDRRDMSQIDGPHHSALYMSGGMGTFTADGRISRGSAWSGRASRHSAVSTQSRSVREQGISAPLMSENSLGWN